MVNDSRIVGEYACKRCGFGVRVEFTKEETERQGIKKQVRCTECGADIQITTAGRPVFVEKKESDEYKSGRFAVGKSRDEE